MVAVSLEKDILISRAHQFSHIIQVEFSVAGGVEWEEDGCKD